MDKRSESRLRARVQALEEIIEHIWWNSAPSSCGYKSLRRRHRRIFHEIISKRCVNVRFSHPLRRLIEE